VRGFAIRDNLWGAGRGCLSRGHRRAALRVADAGGGRAVRGPPKATIESMDTVPDEMLRDVKAAVRRAMVD